MSFASNRDPTSVAGWRALSMTSLNIGKGHGWTRFHSTDYQSRGHAAQYAVDPARLVLFQVKAHTSLCDCSRRSANPDPPRARLAQTLPDLTFSPS